MDLHPACFGHRWALRASTFQTSTVHCDRLIIGLAAQGLLQSLAERKALQEPDVQPAFKGVLSQLEDIADDAPKSPEVVRPLLLCRVPA